MVEWYDARFVNHEVASSNPASNNMVFYIFIFLNNMKYIQQITVTVKLCEKLNIDYDYVKWC